jgi:uncharacterized membrane protein
VLLFAAGICRDMAGMDLFDFAVTGRHPMIRRWRFPRLASTVSGLIQLALAAAILFWLDYRFADWASTIVVFAGFAAWALFTVVAAERNDLKRRSD